MISRPVTPKDSLIVMVVCAILFPFLGALVIFGIHGGDAAATTWMLQRAAVLVIVFQVACGVVGGYILSRVHAKWPEWLILGLLCGYMCVSLFSLYASREWTDVPISQGLIIGVPSGAILSMLVSIPRVVWRIITDRQ